MEQLMTAEEVAELLHVDPVTIRLLVNFRLLMVPHLASASLRENHDILHT
jgi:hypothetical protein